MSNEPYLAVVGAVNIDIGGRSYGPFKRHDSNPGKIVVSFGGAAHNIAHNIKLLGFPVKFITAFGGDNSGAKEHCCGLGFDISHSLTIPDCKSSTYIYINDHNGETVAAMSDMDIYDKLDVEFIKSKLQVLNEALVVVLDTNIPQDTLEYIVNNCTAPIVCDPVSSAKAVKLKNCLSGIAALKPNRYEAEAITGIKVQNGMAAYEAANYLVASGVKKVFLTLGEYGAVCADKSGRTVISPYAKNPVNVTGAGDAFCAAIAISMFTDLSAETIGKLGTAAAAVAMMSEESVAPDMSVKKIREYMTEGEN